MMRGSKCLLFYCTRRSASSQINAGLVNEGLLLSIEALQGDQNITLSNPPFEFSILNDAKLIAGFIAALLNLIVTK